MKKMTALLLALTLVLALVGCSSGGSGKSKLENHNGILEAVDVEGSPLKDCGVHVQVNPAEGTVTFIKTDSNGKDTTEYYKFTPAKNEVEQYYYVSMMGTGFYYYFDLAAGEMVRMEDKDHNDSTQSAKDGGRFDGPAKALKEDVAALQSYFETTYGMSIADAAAGK